MTRPCSQKRTTGSSCGHGSFVYWLGTKCNRRLSRWRNELDVHDPCYVTKTELHTPNVKIVYDQHPAARLQFIYLQYSRITLESTLWFSVVTGYNLTPPSVTYQCQSSQSNSDVDHHLATTTSSNFWCRRVSHDTVPAAFNWTLRELGASQHLAVQSANWKWHHAYGYVDTTFGKQQTLASD